MNIIINISLIYKVLGIVYEKYDKRILQRKHRKHFFVLNFSFSQKTCTGSCYDILIYSKDFTLRKVSWPINFSSYAPSFNNNSIWAPWSWSNNNEILALDKEYLLPLICIFSLIFLLHTLREVVAKLKFYANLEA